MQHIPNSCISLPLPKTRYHEQCTKNRTTFISDMFVCLMSSLTYFRCKIMFSFKADHLRFFCVIDKYIFITVVWYVTVVCL